MDRLDLNWSFEFGLTADEPAGPLVLLRALRGIISEGRPQGSLRLLFFKPNLGRPEVFWLGILMLTAGDRVVFFPAGEITGFDMFHRATPRRARGFPVDHLTLEPDRRGWHLTGTNPRKSAAGPQTLPLSSGGWLWFGMSSAGPEVMPPVLKENQLRFEVPSVDAKRRIDLLKAVRKGAVDQIISLNQEAFSLNPPWYVQFNFAVGPPGVSPPMEEITRFLVNPTVDPTGGIGESFQAQGREHRIQLSDDLEVLVFTFPVLRQPTDRWALMAWG